jgi:hypothetical protein
MGIEGPISAPFLPLPSQAGGDRTYGSEQIQLYPLEGARRRRA